MKLKQNGNKTAVSVIFGNSVLVFYFKCAPAKIKRCFISVSFQLALHVRLQRNAKFDIIIRITTNTIELKQNNNKEQRDTETVAVFFEGDNAQWITSTRQLHGCYYAGRSGLVVTRLPAAREDPGSRRAAGKVCVFTKITAICSFGHGLHTDCSA